MSNWKKYDDESEFADYNDDNEPPVTPLERRPEVAEEDRERFEAVREEASRKADRVFVMNRLADAQYELDYWQKYREKLIKLDEALSQGDLKKVALLTARFRDDPEEPAYGKFRLFSRKRKSNQETGTENEEPALLNLFSNIYKQRGTAGLREYVSLHIKHGCEGDPLIKGIDTVIRDAEANVKEITEIIENNSPEDAASAIRRFGDCHSIWGIKKRILKEEYGIDWLTPDEQFPDVDFD